MDEGAKMASAYDRAATMFSPKGRLYQVEYASKIVEQGTLGIGLVYANGVLFGAEKAITSNLMIPESVEKLFKIDDHIGAISAGLVGDARRLIKIARELAQENMIYYDELIDVEYLAKEISSIKQVFTQYAGMRPFGISFIIGGINNGNKRIFETEPSGALAEYKATAIGRNKKKAMDFMEKKYNEKMNLEEGIKLITNTIKQTKEKNETFEINSLEFAYIEEGKPFTKLSAKELKAIISK
ncbi:MAG: archaeal proteasome endopeptidase complex subunit alpha [Candidatus Diapherotrites archaeon]|nr:archaeal proteasome endopeptidase complex subunit alpha [Candidatus Diapherotrites archaeon]